MSYVFHTKLHLTVLIGWIIISSHVYYHKYAHSSICFMVFGFICFPGILAESKNRPVSQHRTGIFAKKSCILPTHNSKI